MTSKEKKECFICGNTKSDEIEIVIMFSDDDGNDSIEEQYICKEGIRCS